MLRPPRRGDVVGFGIIYRNFQKLMNRISPSFIIKYINWTTAAIRGNSGCWINSYLKCALLLFPPSSSDAYDLKKETVDRFAAKKTKPKNPETTPAQTNSVVWVPEVGVQRATWNNGNGLGNCQLLLSGTTSGLCRIDLVTGRWFKGRELGPGGIGTLRGEVDGDGDVDMDDAEGEEDVSD